MIARSQSLLRGEEEHGPPWAFCGAGLHVLSTAHSQARGALPTWWLATICGVPLTGCQQGHGQAAWPDPSLLTIK